MIMDELYGSSNLAENSRSQFKKMPECYWPRKHTTCWTVSLYCSSLPLFILAWLLSAFTWRSMFSEELRHVKAGIQKGMLRKPVCWNGFSVVLEIWLRCCVLSEPHSCLNIIEHKMARTSRSYYEPDRSPSAVICKRFCIWSHIFHI